MGKLITLWHISPAMNAESILFKGIDPDYSTGKFKRSWFVRWYGIAWALAHVSMKKRIPIWQLACFRVKVNEESVTHFNRNVYTCKDVVITRFMMSGERALARWENQRAGRGRSTWREKVK